MEGEILLQLNHGDISTEFYGYHHQIHQISINHIYIILYILYIYLLDIGTKTMTQLIGWVFGMAIIAGWFTRAAA